VVGDAFAAGIVVRALDAAGDFLRTAVVDGVLERRAAIAIPSGGGEAGDA